MKVLLSAVTSFVASDDCCHGCSAGGQKARLQEAGDNGAAPAAAAAAASARPAILLALAVMSPDKPENDLHGCRPGASSHGRSPRQPGRR
jgi:hypothetical protein